MADDVREVVSCCLAGDQDAMVRLVDLFRGPVFGLCYRMLGHRQDAEDVTQEVFVRVFRSLHQWDNQRDFKPWLLAIAGNRCRTVLGQRKRRPSPRETVSDLPDPSPALRDVQYLAEEVALALDKLREDHRRAFLLFHEQQLSYAEIGEALGCPVGTVKTWIHRARREVARQLIERGVVEERNDGEVRSV